MYCSRTYLLFSNAINKKMLWVKSSLMANALNISCDGRSDELRDVDILHNILAA